MPAIKFILFILFLIVVASFAVKNMASVGVSYYDFKFQVHTVELPLMVVMVVSLILGFLIAWFISIFDLFKLRTTIRKQNKSISSMEEELASIKNASQPSTQIESSIDS